MMVGNLRMVGISMFESSNKGLLRKLNGLNDLGSLLCRFYIDFISRIKNTIICANLWIAANFVLH